MQIFVHRPIVIAVLSLSAFSARGAVVSQLFDRVPSPPASVAAALAVSEQGELITPEYLALRKAIASERAAIELYLDGSATTAVTEANADGAEASSVRAAQSAYKRYIKTYSGEKGPAVALAKRTRWLQAAMGGRMVTVLGAMKPCDIPCTDAEVISWNSPHQAEKQRLAQQDLDQWNSLFADWKSSRKAIIERAQSLIDATGKGASATTATGLQTIYRYRRLMLTEVEVLLSLTELAVRRAFVIESGKTDAVSSSTRSKNTP